MATSYDLTIVLSTYNRCGQLTPAIGRLLAPSATGAPPYEIVLVDNNSSDSTGELIQAFIRRGAPLRYVLEPRQGLSFARNAGVAAAGGDIVAFTDDDVRISDGWVAAVVRAFRERPDVDCVGGRTLPLWPAPPPRWLTRLHWVGPLALQDYGDLPFIVDRSRPLCLAGANLAFRKSVFDRIGLFSPDFPRSEDTELMLRLWMAGRRALYVPDMLVYAAVQPERLTKAYHRRWHANIGCCNARMGFEELADPHEGLRSVRPRVARVLGVPMFAVRQLGAETGRWIRDGLAGRADRAFLHETRVRALASYIRESRRLHRRGIMPVVRPAAPPEDVAEAAAGQVPTRFET